MLFLLVMACGPVDRRANRAEWARAGPCGLSPPRAGLLTVGPPGRKKKYEILKLSV